MTDMTDEEFGAYLQEAQSHGIMKHNREVIENSIRVLSRTYESVKIKLEGNDQQESVLRKIKKDILELDKELSMLPLP